MSQFDAVIGLERLRVIHVNDSKKPLGSRRDRHEHIGKGYIGLEGFRHLVNDPALAEIPRILETPKGPELIEDIENLAVLRSLVRKPRRRKKTGQ
jgi:deoxyribonuclease IV